MFRLRFILKKATGIFYERIMEIKALTKRIRAVSYLMTFKKTDTFECHSVAGCVADSGVYVHTRTHNGCLSHKFPFS